MSIRVRQVSSAGASHSSGVFREENSGSIRRKETGMPLSFSAADSRAFSDAPTLPSACSVRDRFNSYHWSDQRSV